MDYHELNLKGVKSPYNGKFYIGLVLDVINEYLGFDKGRIYYLNGGKELSNCRSARMEIEGSDIKVFASDEGDKYFISGFPSSKDFRDFEKRAPKILEKMLESDKL